MRAGGLLLLLWTPLALAAPQLQCHYRYGGETHTVKSSVQTSPYTGEPVEIGSYFLFRQVFEGGPHGPLAVKLYTYVSLADGPAILHQATFPYPKSTRTHGRYGFTGLQRVYEPIRDSELIYWCEIKGQP